ncbi:threonine/serine dehydratase [Virgibacillus halophilus]|uniref:Threonine/serine dehydratase n=1 Tax=Tigheibacillus halophilus TaxID=361280 RepID=A0ABU5C1Z1_9BACI|nr:threonine/serine dehydratase [Virgibacillus halophilus]
MITITDIRQAHENISAVIHNTPVITSKQLDEMSGNQVFLKSEHLQKTGSFKIRGATNKVKAAVTSGAAFITAASSGNHGQAVAYIANQLGIKARIVVPEDAAASKVSAIKAYNGEIEYCGRTSAERLPRAKELAEKHGGVFIPPYDDPLVIAGQGTVGLEIMEQVKGADIVLVPVGGGGLISGIATAVKAINPAVKVIGIEPELADDTYRSLQAGKLIAIGPTETIADGLRSSQPGDLTFPVIQKYVDDLVLVSESEIRQAQQFIMERMKQVVEPSGAVTTAAVMHHKLHVKHKRIVCVVSGGNIDLSQLANLLPLSV